VSTKQSKKAEHNEPAKIKLFFEEKILDVSIYSKIIDKKR